MSSSDSEDDCYGNIAQKLQSMKNTYKEDKVEITNLLDDTAESVKTKKLPPTDKEAFTEINSPSINSTDNDELTLDAIIANNSKKRVTRSKRKSKEDSEKPESTSNTGEKRGRGGKRGRSRKTATPAADNTSTSVRGRGMPSNSPLNSTRSNRRGRNAPNRRGRQHISHFFNMNPGLPIYSVGNTDEYPDQCDNQQLFTTTNDVVVLEEKDPLDDNEELSVKVYWQSSELFKFTIRRYQKLSPIFDHFSEKENVSHDKLFFMYNDRILKMDDTPDSIDYSIVKFIDGGIVNKSVLQIVTKDKNTKEGIKIKFQCQNVKKPYETIIRPDDKLLVAMMMCAEHLELPLIRLKFKFDGDILSGKNTARELDLEGGECIDVEIMS